MTIAGNNSRVAKLVDRRVHELVGKKTQKDIAEEAGFVNQNMITMIKGGRARRSNLDRVPALARALEVDPTYLFRLSLEQYFTEKTLGAMADAIGTVLSANEKEILEYIRQSAPEEDPPLSDVLRSAIAGALK